MFAAYSYIFVTILYSTFSLPFNQVGSRSSDSELGLNSKRSLSLPQGNAVDLHHQPGFDGDSSMEEQLNRDYLKRNTDGVNWQEIFTPQKLWSLHCQPNCFAQYPRSDGDSPTEQTEDDILLHLSADKDLMKFLQWTVSHLGSLHSYNASGNYPYNPGLDMWTNLNLSGRRELPLYVEEPQYIVVRRESDLEPSLRSSSAIPFIPPRGRKYEPSLEHLRSRYDVFVPNRGKKDKIQDIFKYDDLFFPNRGRKRYNIDTSTASENGLTRNGNLARYYYQLTDDNQKKLHQPLSDCFTLCDDITSIAPAPALPLPPPMVVPVQVENINGLVSASALHVPRLPLRVSSSSSSSSALDGDGHQDAAAAVGATCAECQKGNDGKINGFDQSVKAQTHQSQYSKRGAPFADIHRVRRLPASVEAGASSFLPLIRPDQVHRLQSFPIRNKQWRDYYF